MLRSRRQVQEAAQFEAEKQIFAIWQRRRERAMDLDAQKSAAPGAARAFKQRYRFWEQRFVALEREMYRESRSRVTPGKKAFRRAPPGPNLPLGLASPSETAFASPSEPAFASPSETAFASPPAPLPLSKETLPLSSGHVLLLHVEYCTACRPP